MADQYGQLDIDGERAVLSYVRRLPYPIEAVWSAITDPTQRAMWFGATTIDARAGGLIEMVPTGPAAAPEAKRMTGRIRVWDPPHVLEHEWHQQVLAEDSVVRYELSEDGEGTLLKFTHRGLSEPNARGFSPGTHAYLDRLECHLAAAALPNWAKRYAELAAHYETGALPWTR